MQSLPAKPRIKKPIKADKAELTALQKKAIADFEPFLDAVATGKVKMSRGGIRK